MKRNTSRKAEEAYLAETLRVVRDNVREYGQEVAKMQEDIDEMLEHYHDNDAEVLTILNNTVTMHTHMKRALERNEKALKKPYFGRIVFHDEALNKEESLYIGRTRPPRGDRLLVGGSAEDKLAGGRTPSRSHQQGMAQDVGRPAPGNRVHRLARYGQSFHYRGAGRLPDGYGNRHCNRYDILAKTPRSVSGMASRCCLSAWRRIADE